MLKVLIVEEATAEMEETEDTVAVMAVETADTVEVEAFVPMI